MIQIQLLANSWKGGAKKSANDRVALFEKTLAAAGADSDKTAISHADLARLLADEEIDAETWRVRITAAAQKKAYQHLLITKKGVKCWRVLKAS